MSTDPKCHCGHRQSEHGKTTGHCLGCITCVTPGVRHPHVNNACGCTRFRPATACSICGPVRDPDGEPCAECADIAKVAPRVS